MNQGLLNAKINRRDVLKWAGGLSLAGIAGARPLGAAAARKSPLGEAPDGSLADLLTLLPESLLTGSRIDYADYARQRSALRVPSTASAADRRAALEGMAFSAVGDFSSPEWSAAFGFGLGEIDELVELRSPQASITILRGRFDRTILTSSWRAASFSEVPAARGSYFNGGEDWAFSETDPISVLHKGLFNNVALLNPGTVIASATTAGIELAIEVFLDRDPSTAESPIFAAMRPALPSSLVSATLLDGSWLQPQLDPRALAANPDIPATEKIVLTAELPAQIAEARQMPQLSFVLAGSTAGVLSPETEHGPGLPEARSIVIAVVGDANEVATAVDVAADRLERQTPLGTGYADRPYSEIFAERNVTVVAGQPSIAIDLAPAPGTPATIARDLLLQQNLTFVYWSE